MQFTGETIPMGYKIRLNDYIGMSRPPDQSAIPADGAKAEKTDQPSQTEAAAETPKTENAGKAPAAAQAAPTATPPDGAKTPEPGTP